MSVRTLFLSCVLGIGLCAFLLGCAAVREELGLVPVAGEEGVTSEDEDYGAMEMEESGPSYADDIQPIFDANCTRCHGRRRQERKLNLTSYSTMMSRNVITSNDAEGSVLYQKITLEGSGRMPLQSDPLSEEESKKIKDWINAGAKEN